MVRLLAVPIVVSVVVSAQPAPTLPDHDAFVRETRSNLAKSQREQYRYSYKERRTELHTNPFGRLGSGGMVAQVPYPRPHRGARSVPLDVRRARRLA